MRNFVIAACLVALVAGTIVAQDPSTLPAPKNPSQAKLETQQDKVSYAIGLNIGRSIVQDKLQLNPDAIAIGIRDAMTRTEPALSDEQLEEVMKAFQQQMVNQAQEQAAAEAKANLEAGANFLKANSAKEGVMVTQTGLQYKVLKKGTGATPKKTDVVTTHYRGTLLDGTEFDSSYRRGEPASFPVDRVIAGWTEALQLMKVGDRWQLFIPSNLAYGEQGSRGAIGPNQTLIFEIELLGIESQE